MENKISLYCVPTPIGNLSDMSPRCLEILRSVDFIAAEDTRNSGVMLKLFDIKKPMISYFEHNRAERGQIIVDRLLKGETCALITDAGMPAISDPGEELVRQCHEAGLTVSAIPGPCAAVTALAMSGIPTKRFTFEGFLSTAKNSREKHLASLDGETRTMIFYEAPHHLKVTLAALAEHFGKDRRISLVREISKIYEEVRLTTIGEAMDYYEENLPRGEFVLIVEGKRETDTPQASEEDVEECFAALIAQGKTKSEAAKETAKKFGLKKSEVYERFK